jgi:hypothetical protein
MGGVEGQLGAVRSDLNLVKEWKLQQFVATMRTGIDPGGHELSEQMPWRPIGKMDDEELGAVYEYLTHLGGSQNATANSKTRGARVTKRCSDNAELKTALLHCLPASRMPQNPGSRHKSDRRDWQGEHVADAAHRLDDARRAVVTLELAPQPQDLHIDAAVEDIFMQACRLQQVLAAEGSQRRVEKCDQHGIFTLR